MNVKLPTLPSDPLAALSQVGMAFGDLITPTIRLGVTGLSRSGKTVFITALVRCLSEAKPVPEFVRISRVQGFRAYLEPQPDDDIPRFAYEDHLADLSAEEPVWPESTRKISQLRLTLEWPADDMIREAFGLRSRLHIDIIDYPGEWLIDLGLLNQSFEEWSKEALFTANNEGLMAYSNEFLDFLKRTDIDGPLDEQVAIEGARIYTDYISKAREADPSRAALGPGRFLLPGDLAGSPQLTFFPANKRNEAAFGSQGGTSGATTRNLLARRYEKYKKNVVQPFFEKHFSQLDRQIVLVDALSALNGGAEALVNLEQGLEGALRAFRPGTNSWLSFLLTKRIDRIVFAATKADHIHHTSHHRLQAILEQAVSRAANRASAAGAGFRCIALASLRATEDVDKHSGENTYHCIRGVPVRGETVDGRKFDGKRAAVVFPGDLPTDPLDAFDGAKSKRQHYSFVRFRPPPLNGQEGKQSLWPHIGMQRTIDFLFGDHLP